MGGFGAFGESATNATKSAEKKVRIQILYYWIAYLGFINTCPGPSNYCLISIRDLRSASPLSLSPSSSLLMQTTRMMH